MLKTKHNIVAIGILGVALAIVIVVVGGISWHRVPATPGQTAQNTTSTSGTSGAASSTSAPRVYTPHPPHGSVTYQIAEAATQLPSFVQATIDPADVAVGQVQHFVIVTSDPNPIVSVVATITTDHKTITVPLVSQGAPATSMLVPRTITVGADNKLALIAPGTNAAGDLAAADTEQGTHIANAATANDTEFTGQWTVEDTHSAKYNTVFTAKDSAGNENSVTLEWTDPCAFSTVNNYGGGTATVSGNCSISGIDGPELGNLLVSSGATLTLGSGATLVINSGYNISFSSGAIAIPSGAQILFGKDMCGTDNDGDGYIGGSSWTICGTGVTRANISGATADCNDGD
ncbi:MAG: hypothetical protein P4L99_09295, partial [Chthoniobacter sp.]|nr:hypothetical protein [Chthoniobacter sp.]